MLSLYRVNECKVMSEEEYQEDEKKIGGQPGNQNARKHGFYSSVLDEKERKEYERAIEVEGLDEEIAMLRVKIMSLLEKDPENVRLITQAVNSLIRLVIINYHIDKGDTSGVVDAVKEVFKNVAVPVGIAIGSHLLK